MNAFTFVATVFIIALVNGGQLKYWKGTEAIDFEEPCVRIGHKPLSGYYVARQSDDHDIYYKRVDDINCIAIEKMKPLYLMQSAPGVWYFAESTNTPISDAVFSNCTERGRFRTARCDGFGTGPRAWLPVHSMMPTPTYEGKVERCQTMWTDASDAGTTNGRSKTSQVAPLLNMPDTVSQPNTSSQPMMTITINKWTLIILALIACNIATLTAIWYCRQKKTVDTTYKTVDYDTVEEQQLNI